MVDAIDGCRPVIGRAVVFKLKGAQRVGNPFKGIADGVGEVIHRIDAPLVPCPQVMGKLDAVEGGVSHVDVGAAHIDFSSEDMGPFSMLALAHLLKQAQVLFDAAIPVWTVLSRFGKRATVLFHLFS